MMFLKLWKETVGDPGKYNTFRKTDERRNFSASLLSTSSQSIANYGINDERL